MVDGSLGKITKEQRAAELEVWLTSLVNPDFAPYAELCGTAGIRVEAADQLDSALERAFGTDRPALVDVTADAELV